MILPPRIPYAPPEPIDSDHRLDLFDCGNPSLNASLRRHALGNEGKASRTYVVRSLQGDASGAVVAYYSLAAGAVFHDEAPRKLTRNMPNPIPVLLLGRLAVDSHHRGRGLGEHLLKEALQRSLEASRRVGVRAIVVHAIDVDAAAFYTHLAPFQAFPAGSLTLFLPIETVARAL